MTTPPDHPAEGAAPSNAAPGRPLPPSPRRAAMLNELAEDVRALRRDTSAQLVRLAGTVTENAGLLAEWLPKVSQLDELVVELGDKVTSLAAAVAAKDDEEEEEPGPKDWPSLPADVAETEWELLATWVAGVLGPFYEIRREQLPDCWPLHRPAVIELVTLRRLYAAAHATGAAATAAGEWHARWRRDALANIAAAVPAEWCRPNEHRVHRTDRERDRYAQPGPPSGPPAGPPWGQGAAPGGGTPRASAPPRIGPEQEISTAEHWRHHYETAVAADLAWRRARDAAGQQ